MEVIILAGGLGTRLRSVVSEVPKCMAPIGEKPFLWYLLKYLTKYNVTRVILSVGHLRNVIIDWIDGHGDEFPFAFDYAVEKEPMGTGGGIKLALERCSQPDVAVLNGDTFFDVDLDELFRIHRLYPSSITLALKPMKDFERYGNVKMCDVDNRITAFEEKKHCEQGLINGGVYVINKLEPIFKGLPQKFSFETEVLQPQCVLGKLYGVVQNGYFIDIGIPEDYAKANMEFSNLPF